MEHIFEIMGHMDNIQNELSAIYDTDETMMLAVLCMMIDYCGVKCGKSSMELLDMITPQIEAVNEALGVMDVAR